MGKKRGWTGKRESCSEAVHYDKNERRLNRLPLVSLFPGVSQIHERSDELVEKGVVLGESPAELCVAAAFAPIFLRWWCSPDLRACRSLRALHESARRNGAG